MKGLQFAAADHPTTHKRKASKIMLSAKKLLCLTPGFV
jgi:hypothetical protein